jgi:hypothetical protein
LPVCYVTDDEGAHTVYKFNFGGGVRPGVVKHEDEGIEKYITLLEKGKVMMAQMPNFIFADHG